MVTAKKMRVAMNDEPRAAAGTPGPPAAGDTEERRRKSTAIDEDERLLASRQSRVDCGDQLGRDPLRRRAASVRHERDGRLPGTRHRAKRKREAAVASSLDVHQAFKRGGGTSEHDRNRALLCPPDRDVTAVIPNTVLLLVRRIVLLIDDDEREPRQRGEYRKPRSENQIGIAGGGEKPVASANAGRKSAVQRHRAPSGNRRGNTLLELRRQIDLRHEDQHLAATRDALRGSGEIDLGLSAAGDALEQERRESTPR